MTKIYVLNSEKNVKELLPKISRTLQQVGIDNLIKAQTIFGVGWEIVFHQSRYEVGCRFLVKVYGKNKKETAAIDALLRALIQAMVDQGEVWGPGFHPQEVMPLPDFFKSWEHMENDKKKASQQERDLIYFYMTTDIEVKCLKEVFIYTDMYSKITKLRSEYPNAKICNEQDSDLLSRQTSIRKWGEYIAYRLDEKKAHEAKVSRFWEAFHLNKKRVDGAMQQGKQDGLA